MNAGREASPTLPRVNEAPHLIGALLEGLPEPAWLVDGASLTVSAVNRAATRPGVVESWDRIISF